MVGARFVCGVRIAYLWWTIVFSFLWCGTYVTVVEVNEVAAFPLLGRQPAVLYHVILIVPCTRVTTTARERSVRVRVHHPSRPQPRSLLPTHAPRTKLHCLPTFQEVVVRVDDDRGEVGAVRLPHLVVDLKGDVALCVCARARVWIPINQAGPVRRYYYMITWGVTDARVAGSIRAEHTRTSKT